MLAGTSELLKKHAGWLAYALSGLRRRKTIQVTWLTCRELVVETRPDETRRDQTRGRSRYRNWSGAQLCRASVGLAWFSSAAMLSRTRAS